jgi:hypothetical protein
MSRSIWFAGSVLAAFGVLLALGAAAVQHGPAPTGVASGHIHPRQAVWHVPAPPPAPRWLLGRVEQPLTTRFGTVGSATPLGSQTWLLIVRRRGVLGTALVPIGGRQVLVPVDLRRLELRWTRVRVDVDLSRLRLRLLDGRRVAGTFPVAAGASGTPTPTGQYMVTDRVFFAPGGPYGTFALGLSAYQGDLPSGWNGGSQIAIHGTPDTASIGQRASLGCIRVGTAGLQLLRRLVPLGAPVSIHL